MITRNYTPEDQSKIIRAVRFTAASSFVVGVILLGLGLTVIARRGQTIFDYGFVVLGLAWLGISLRSWTRARRYRRGL